MFVAGSFQAKFVVEVLATPRVDTDSFLNAGAGSPGNGSAWASSGSAGAAAPVLAAQARQVHQAVFKQLQTWFALFAQHNKIGPASRTLDKYFDISTTRSADDPWEWRG